MIIENETKLDFSDVLIRPKRSTLTSRKQVDLSREYKFKRHVYEGIPIMAANMDGVGTFEMAEALSKHKLFTCLVKNYDEKSIIEWINRCGYAIKNNWAYSMGTSAEEQEKFWRVYNAVGKWEGIEYVCIDVANGYTEYFVDYVKRIRGLCPNVTIIAGNVVTREITEELILNGADIVKVGIGPGSVCTTRIKTGVGYPQLSAIIECADAAHGLGGYIIADGGCTSSGDIAKAFGAGADFVMLGGMLAGHEEGGGDAVFDDGVQTGVKFYGMSSKAANEKHFGGLKDYRASEGREVVIPYKGEVSDTVLDILGGIRSTCTYVGASNLKNLSKCTTFIRVNNQYNRVYEK